MQRQTLTIKVLLLIRVKLLNSSVAVSVLLLGRLCRDNAPVAQAQVLMAQSRGMATYQKNQQLNKLLEQGRKLVEAGVCDHLAAQKSPNFSGIGYLKLIKEISQPLRQLIDKPLPLTPMPIFTMH